MITYRLVEMRFDDANEAMQFFGSVGEQLLPGASQFEASADKIATPKLAAPAPAVEVEAETDVEPKQKTRRTRKKKTEPAKEAPAADAVTLDMIRPVMNDILKADPDGGPDSIMGVFGKFSFTEDGKTRPVTKLGQLNETDYPAMHAEMSALLA